MILVAVVVVGPHTQTYKHTHTVPSNIGSFDTTVKLIMPASASVYVRVCVFVCLLANVKELSKRIREGGTV
jgi:hypothetical protein